MYEDCGGHYATRYNLMANNANVILFQSSHWMVTLDTDNKWTQSKKVAKKKKVP